MPPPSESASEGVRRPESDAPAARLSASAAPRSIEMPTIRIEGFSALAASAMPAMNPPPDRPAARSGRASRSSSAIVPWPGTCVVEGRDVDHTLLGDQPAHLLLCLVLRLADVPHLGAERLNRLYFTVRHQIGEADHGAHAMRTSDEGERPAMIARRAADDAERLLLGGELRHRIGGAPDLKAPVGCSVSSFMRTSYPACCESSERTSGVKTQRPRCAGAPPARHLDFDRL